MSKVVLGVVVLGVALAGYGYWNSTRSHAPVCFTNETYDTALAANTGDGKPLVVVMSATWCPPCQAMKKEVWTDSSVESWIAANAKAIYVDVDQQGAAAQACNVSGIPAIIVFKGGREVSRQVGYMDAGQLIGWLDRVK